MTPVDRLAQEIRRIDGGHQMGAGMLAEALWPFVVELVAEHFAGQTDAEWLIPADGGRAFCDEIGPDGKCTGYFLFETLAHRQKREAP